jgi:hypothetical protein
MKSHRIFSLVLAGVLFLAWNPARAAETKTKTDGATSPTQPVLEKGMSEEAILKIYGKPDDITPLKSADLKAEKWTYRRILKQGVIQTADTQRAVNTFGGFGTVGGAMMVDAVEPDYRLKYVKIYQVTSLLMVGGKLTLGKQWVERNEAYAD